MAECKDCIHFCVCDRYTAPNESYPEVGGCKLFKPAADVVEVERGSWLPQMLMGGETVCCSECKTIGSPSWNWCPNCGADMRGERDDGSGSEKG